MLVNDLKCCFCQSTRVKLIYKGRFHKFKKDHGPNNFYTCVNCRSGFTYPLPSAFELAALYQSFENGMIPATRHIRDNNPLSQWYKQCVTRAVANNQHKPSKTDAFYWIDIGAGGGEIAKIMAKEYPFSKGFAVDFHEKPKLLAEEKNITWIQCDLNEPDFYKHIPLHNFKMVFCVTVLEHVLFPDDFIKNILKLLGEEGGLYLTVPDMGSIAAKTMRRFWPYLIFGEHINIPSKKGMQLLLKRFQADDVLPMKKIIKVNPVVLPYPFTYYLNHFGFRNMALIFTTKWTIGINTGIMEATVI